MNVPALLIATAFGAAFLAAELRWQIHPSTTISPTVVMSALSSEHMKARTAVRNVLLDPDSAQFESMRSVTEGTSKLVCGLVKARDRSGSLSQAAFVYAVDIDFARVDDGGRMTRQQSAYRPCPAPEAEQTIAQTDKKLTLSPTALALVKTAQKLIPEGDPATLTELSATLAPGGASGGGGAGGQRMEQQIGALAARTALPAPGGTSGQGGTGTERVAVSKPVEWRADQPPRAWPKFPQGHPLAEPAPKRPPADALAMAKDVEERWKRSEAAGDPRLRPSSKQIREACRALLTIDTIDIEYRQAWAAFVRLQEMDRVVAAG
ncbi:hypothetical protein ACQR1Y_15290 [Bradyrhizobium sp. HKCCYLRH3099]|uniref:hypothetical protein n=1 Tax=unclassified Bradyrhizobium TaxID=2631580 RepID=UPI003EB94E8B